MKAAEVKARAVPPRAPSGPPPSIPDMTARVNQGYLPDLPDHASHAVEMRPEPAGPPRWASLASRGLPARPRYGEEVHYGRGAGGGHQGQVRLTRLPHHLIKLACPLQAPGAPGTPQYGSQYSWDPLPRAGGRGGHGGQGGRY